MPKLSLIMPVYNREKTLHKALSEILNQDFTDFEVAIIDDGSKDKSKEIISGFNDKRLKYFYQPNRGEYSATNAGFKNSVGEYVALVHADDVLLPKSLSRRVRALDENPEVNLVHGDLIYVNFLTKEIDIRCGTDDKEGQKILKNCCMPEDDKRKKRYFFQHLTFMYRRELLNKAGLYNESLKYAGDLDWTLRALKYAKVKRVPELLYLYTRDEKAVSSKAIQKNFPIDKMIENIKNVHCSK